MKNFREFNIRSFRYPQTFLARNFHRFMVIDGMAPKQNFVFDIFYKSTHVNYRYNIPGMIIAV